MFTKISRETSILIVAASGHFLTHLAMQIFPTVVIPLAKDANLDLGDTFILSFFMYLLYGGLAIPVGLLADKWSRLGMLRISFAGIGISLILAGFIKNSMLFAATIGFTGLFCSIYHPTGLGLIANEIQKQGKSHGINGIFGNLGLSFAPLISGLIMIFASWRLVFITVGVIALVILFLSYLVSFTETAVGDKASNLSSNGKANSRSIYKYFAILCIAMMFGGLADRANMTVLTAYFVQNATGLINNLETILQFADAGVNTSSGYANIVVSSLFLFSMVGQYVGGRLADIYDLRKLYIMFQMIAIPVSIGIALSTDIPLYILTGMQLFFTLGMQPIENSLVSKFMPRSLLSTGYGIKFTFTFGISSLAIYQLAYIEKTYNLNYVYWMIASELCMVVILSYLILHLSKSSHSFIGNQIIR